MIKKLYLIALIIFSPGSALAAWHVEDVGGELVIIGAGESPSGVLNFLSMRCGADQLRISADTMAIASKDEDLEYYTGAHARLGFGAAGERQEIVVDARASRSVGDVLTLNVELDAEQSRAIVQSITTGKRFEFTPIHAEIGVEDSSFKVMSFGFVSVMLALSNHCPDLLKK